MDEKRKLLGNFENIVKVFDENSIEKLNFLIFIYFCFGKFVTKNRAFGNNIIFLQQFFRFRGGGNFPPFPLATLTVSIHFLSGQPDSRTNLKGFIEALLKINYFSKNITQLHEGKRHMLVMYN